jgi:hypothetical protein
MVSCGVFDGGFLGLWIFQFWRTIFFGVAAGGWAEVEKQVSPLRCSQKREQLRSK